MAEVNSSSHSQASAEESSMTGGKSVSEIVQILRTNANLTLEVKDVDDNEDAEEQPNRTNQVFPWIKKFTTQCREVIVDPDIKKLDELITDFLKYIEDSAKECYRSPRRAHKLKTWIVSFLQVFNSIYGQLKQPLEHTCYLDKMSDVMALTIDIELKSSRRGREHPKKISERICSSLFVYLDKSIEHILDTVLKAKFFIKKHSDICCPVMARLLKEKPPGPMYETTYVRYLLSFKLWKKLAGKEHYLNINRDAVAKLTPPPDFADKLKSGLFSNVLPYVSKSEKDRITLFFMQSPFNVKKKAQVFLREEKKLLPNMDFERNGLFDDEVQIVSFFDDEGEEMNDQPDMLMNDIWKNMVDKEDDFLDNLFLPMDEIDSSKDEEDTIIIDIKKTKPKEKSKKLVKDRGAHSVMKTSIKKRKALRNNNNVAKSMSSKEVVMDLLRSDLTKPDSQVTPQEEISVVSCIKPEDPLSSLIHSPEQKQHKPCATVEPEQCKEVTDSLSNITEVLPIKLIQNPTTSCTESQQSSNVETSLSAMVTNPELAIVNPTISRMDTLEITPSTTVDSSGIYEGVNSETISKDMFVPTDSTFKIGKPEDARMLEENYVAEEVVISSDMEQDSGCHFLIKIDQTDIMNVIGITRDSTAFCNDEVIVHSELSMKDLEKQQMAISSLLDNNIALNSSKEAQTKEHSSVSPENQYLSSIIESTETNENYVSLYRRQDSYTCNEMFLQRLFSDPTSVDEGSDDDSRYQNRRKFAGGGKIRAFREQMEESKSDNDEDFEPSSESQEQSPMDTSSDMTGLQSVMVESSPPDSDQETKNPQDCAADEISPHPDERSEKKFSQQEHGQMKQLSVHLSMGDLISANEHVSNKEKTTPKGMFEPPDSILHFSTVDFDTKFAHFQCQLFNLYSTVENILDTDPVPCPPNKVYSQLDTTTNGHLRCPCYYCNKSFAILQINFESLYGLRSTRILHHVDKKRILTRILDKKMEDDKLLKSIEDTIAQNPVEVPNPDTKTGSIDSVDIKIGATPEKVTLPKIETENTKPKNLPVTVTQTDLKSTQSCEKSENKNEYASLPPKKRKAFNVELDPNHNPRESFASPNDQHVSKNKKTRTSGESIKIKRDCTSKFQVEGTNSETLSGKSGKSDSNISESPNRFSPVKIKAVDGSYCVLNDFSPISDSITVGEPDVSNENIPKSMRKKCQKKRRKCHRSKEEKRLRKEQKRLKKLKKLEESLNNLHP